ncbi:HlyD family efflux transporter periplasmic adaptor subunit [Pseudanabaena sp. PCC 6802]|uniref:HlyD family efflux transporter periplasmic adaptor subunit n=1 Tax=Pseudanabaena sp. PCC 6802 TaxID=118173 RepID=UPI00034AE5C7|nr:HlyD family efflux transporter periplasmic adaptor subunit [Pseudanabaena sp. PCC 6802]
MSNISNFSQESTQNGHKSYRQISSTKELQLQPVEAELSDRAEILIDSQDITSQDEDWSGMTKELVNSLPRVWTRGLFYCLLAFVAIGLPWAALSRVDETGSARGRLEPKGKTFRIDAPVAGTVSKVLVQEGQLVQANQPLLVIESEAIESELQQAQTKLEGQLNRLNQAELLKNQLAISMQFQQQQNQAQDLAKLSQVEQAKYNLRSSNVSLNLQKVEKLAPIDQARQSLEASQVAYNLAASREERDKVEVNRYKQLWQQGVVPEIQFLEKEKLAAESRRLRVQSGAEIEQAKLRLAEQQTRYQTIITQAQWEVTRSKLNLDEQQNSYQSTIHAGRIALLKSNEQLKEVEGQITSLKTEIAQNKVQIQALKFQLGQRVVKAPVSGTIFQLPIQRAGVVLQPSSLVAEIAPQDSPMILRSQIATSESGSLREGLPVKIKFDAYPFQDYGVVEGKLVKMARTSKVTETAQGQVATFDLEIELAKPCIQTRNECITLMPGQTATAEIIVRQRHVIDFILDPFKKLQNGGLEL